MKTNSSFNSGLYCSGGTRSMREENFKMGNEYELYHHGILGQKWGIRRFQNEDGTLTAEGKRRYRLDSNGKYVKRTRAERKAYDKKVKQLAEAAKAKKNKSPRGKAINELTDKQLDKYIDRMTKEKRALELRADVNRLDPKPVSRGEQFARKFWDQAIQPALVNAGKSYLDKMVRDLTSAADKAKKAEEAAKQREFDDAKRESLLWTNRANAERQKQAYDELIKIQKDKEKEAKENEDKEKDKNK